ncbi:MAG: ankyrin repeat domain-containing protein [Spirochaetia bacterium]|nr:ankyrin repeat domain-containing protein [Spirochaetia bacterium]
MKKSFCEYPFIVILLLAFASASCVVDPQARLEKKILNPKVSIPELSRAFLAAERAEPKQKFGFSNLEGDFQAMERIALATLVHSVQPSNEPWPQILDEWGFTALEKALFIADSGTNLFDKGLGYSLAVQGAVTAQKTGRLTLARNLKFKVLKWSASRKTEYRDSFPALTYAESEVWESIPSGEIFKTPIVYDPDPQKALAQAAQEGDVDAMSRFVASGARPEGFGKMESPLFDAVGYGQLESVVWLLAHGARADATNRFGLCVGGFTSGANSKAIFQALQAAGGDLTARDPWGRSVLMAAAIKCPADAVEYLLTIDHDVNHQAQGYDTALMNAALGGNIAVARLLLEAGARTNLVRSDGHTAESLARANENGPMVELLRGKR